jgi:hypothetical protein
VPCTAEICAVSVLKAEPSLGATGLAETVCASVLPIDPNLDIIGVVAIDWVSVLPTNLNLPAIVEADAACNALLIIAAARTAEL